MDQKIKALENCDHAVRTVETGGAESSMRGFLIELEWPQQHLELADALSLFEPRGIKLDEGYGLVVVNSRTGPRYILHGWATLAARESAERQIPGVHFFADMSVVHD